MAGAVDSTIGATSDNHDEAPVGVDFRSAYYFTESSGTKIILGDRPIEITLARFVHALSFQECVGLFWALLRVITNKDAPSTKLVPNTPTSSDTSGGRVSTTAEVTGEEDDDAIASLSRLLKEALPNKQALAALTTERDSYLAWSLKRSRAVGGAHRVVGVVGRAHLNGVMAEMDRDLGGSVLSFQDLTARPLQAPKSRLLRVIWEVALWGSTAVLLFPDLVHFPFGE
jgi:pheromone shutdown protein TraB